MKQRRIKIGAIRPNERLDLRIKGYPLKQSAVSQRSEKFALHNGREIDRLLRAVIKRNSQPVRTDDLKRCDPKDFVFHLANLEALSGTADVRFSDGSNRPTAPTGCSCGQASAKAG